MTKKKSTKKKRTISPEHLAALQAGRAKAQAEREAKKKKEQRHKKIVSDANELEQRMWRAQKDSNKPVKIGRKTYRFDK